MQQIVDLAARGCARRCQQAGGGTGVREPAAHGLPDETEHRKNVQPGEENHRQAWRQIPDAGQCLKGQLEQKARYNAKIDVVAAIVVGHIPQGIRRGVLPGGGVVGVGKVSHSRGRVFFQIEPPLQKAVSQCAVLGGRVGRPVVDVHGEVDAARTRPVGRVVKARGDARVEAVAEGGQERRRAEGQLDSQHRRAVFALMGGVGVAPEDACRAQGKARQQQRQHNRETQDREIQRAAGVGVNGVQLGVQWVAPVLSVKARGRQRQAVCLAGEIQAAGPAAGRRRGHRPVPTLAGDCGGFIGSGNVQVQPHVFLLRRVAVGQ